MLRRISILFYAYVKAEQILHRNNYSCTSTDNVLRNDFHWRGTNLGGWIVLEPWITPSLFYQFLGLSEPNYIAMDSYTFCKALGAKEANKQLRRHWSSWVTDDQIQGLYEDGVDTIRLPIGDWMYVPYEPFTSGCWDGALEEVKRVLDLCSKYDLKVIIDIHGMKDSQNGCDNSGHARNIEWTFANSSYATFEHYSTLGANWIGDFNITTKQYDSINYKNIEHSLQVVKAIVEMYKDESAVIGIEPVNEPWYFTPMEPLTEYYWKAYEIVQEVRPNWVIVLDDGFRLYLDTWKTFMHGCNNYVIDTHRYQAWENPLTAEVFALEACNAAGDIHELEAIGVPIIVGEWSLATDNCALWLNGFNDNVPGYPKVECTRVVCESPYMGFDQPGTPVSPHLGRQSPFGAGDSYVEFGMCPIDKPFPNEDVAMRRLALSKLNVFDVGTHGQFYWNFRTENTYRWNFRETIRRGWLPNKQEWANYDNLTQSMSSICAKSPVVVPVASPSLTIKIIVFTIIFFFIFGVLSSIYYFDILRLKNRYQPVPDLAYSF